MFPTTVGGLWGVGFRCVNTQVKETDQYLGMHVYHSRQTSHRERKMGIDSQYSTTGITGQSILMRCLSTPVSSHLVLYANNARSSLPLSRYRNQKCLQILRITIDT